MLIDTGMTIAYKCSSCGTFEFFEVSLFKFLYKKESYLTCHCNKSSVVITRMNSRVYRITVPCISCEDDHVSYISVKDIMNREEANILHCPKTGMQLCFIGKDDVVCKKVDNFEKELDDLINTFGYDNYFKNTHVMFEALNRIHDFAEQGNLQCECGNSDIELLLLSDKIHLICKYCGGSKIINAASNEDLKDSLLVHRVLLLDGGARKFRI